MHRFYLDLGGIRALCYRERHGAGRAIELIADLADFRREGLVERGVPIGDVRYVRFRDGDPSGRAEIDVITKDDNLTWRFGKGSASNPSVRELAALLADRMDIPAAERIALRELPAAESAAKQLAG